MVGALGAFALYRSRLLVGVRPRRGAARRTRAGVARAGQSGRIGHGAARQSRPEIWRGRADERRSAFRSGAAARRQSPGVLQRRGARGAARVDRVAGQRDRDARRSGPRNCGAADRRKRRELDRPRAAGRGSGARGGADYLHGAGEAVLDRRAVRTGRVRQVGRFRALWLLPPGALVLLVVLGTVVRYDAGWRAALDDEAREYVRLAVALGERDPDSLDYYAGPSDLVADVRSHPPSLPDLERAADAAIARLEHVDLGAGPVPRRQRLIRELRALRTRAALLLGDRPRYDVESEALFGAVPGLPDDRRFARIRSRIDALLPAAAGRLVDRYAGYEHRFVVAAERVPDLFARALAESRRRTLAHLQVSTGETVTVEYVHNRPWAAYSRYQGNGHSVIS